MPAAAGIGLASTTAASSPAVRITTLTFEMQLPLDRLLEPDAEGSSVALAGVEDHVPAAEEGRDVRVAKRFDDLAEVGHCHALGPPDIDATQQRDEGRDAGRHGRIVERQIHRRKS
jgi:hypothetical protein